MSDQPPDQWDHEESEPTPRYGRKKSEKSNRQLMSIAAEEVRALWVAAFRAHHLDRTGEASRYDSSPCWDGGFDPRTKRTYKEPVWPKLIAKAEASGYAPRELIESLFSEWAADTSPTPHHATAETNLRRTAARRLVRKRRVADSLRTEEAIFKADLWGVMQSTPDPREATRFVLNDTGRTLSPLFRYSIAVIRELQDVADRWERAAKAQFQNDSSSYLEYWTTLIPEKLRSTVQTAA